MDRLYVIFPAYNEQANLRTVLEGWYPAAERTGLDSRLVVVNDGSTDGTAALLARLQERMPQLEVLTQANGGHSAALRRGYRYALERGADYVFQTDSDGQTCPEEFWPLWEARASYDYQIGWRRRRADGLGRGLVTRVLRLSILVCCRRWVPDANAPFRLMRGEALGRCLERISPRCPLTNVWLSILLVSGGGRGRFCPITFRSRQGGVNSLNFRRIFSLGLQSVRELWALGRALDR